MVEELSREDFLDRKRDYSPFLVHLTKDGLDEVGVPVVSAREVLESILDEQTLKAANHFCYFSEALKDSQSGSVQDKFRVVCFTETPISQVYVLLNRVEGRNFKPEPFGLVFKKEYIREAGGNPVFYVTKEIAKPLFTLYREKIEGQEDPPADLCRLLALITVCEEGNDWHWEREWRFVGDLKFGLREVYCGLCPESEIPYFENRYSPITFISPYWGINKILDKLVEKEEQSSDIPF